MPSDFLVASMAGPVGILIVVVLLGVAYALWRTILGSDYRTIGVWPLAYGFIGALIGMVAVSFVDAYFEFTSRVASGLLNESDRWTIVPSWTIYASLLLLPFFLAHMAFLGTPVSAALIAKRKFSPLMIVALLAALWIVTATLGSISAPNSSELASRMIALREALLGSLPSIVLVAAPFMFGIYVSLRLRRNAADAS